MKNKFSINLKTLITPIVIRYIFYIIATICTATIDFMANDIADLTTDNNYNNMEVFNNVVIDE